MEQTSLTVFELVKKIERREIRLPNLQRRYVWKKEQVRRLLDSLYRGYPSGTILTWKSDEKKEIKTQDFAVNQKSSEQRGFELLLDGQQRLTSLSAVIRGEPVKMGGREQQIKILFNLKHPKNPEKVINVSPDDNTTDATKKEKTKHDDHMIFSVNKKALADLPHWVSVTDIFKKEKKTSVLLKEAGITAEDEDYDLYLDRIQKVRNIRDYKYGVYILGSDKTYEEVTDIFVRVNSGGSDLGTSDLALAQITARWEDSLQMLEEFEADCNRNFNFNLKLATHLKNLVAFATGESQSKIVGSLSRERLESAWEDARKGMDFALRFLKNSAEIDNPALLSSPFIIITLAKYGHRNKFEIKDGDRLRYWTLMANAKGRYSKGSSITLLNKDLDVLQQDRGIEGLLQNLKEQVGLGVSSDELENKDRRSAYFKTMFMAFRKDGAEDWKDTIKISKDFWKSQHAVQGHHIFPRALLKEKGISGGKTNDICNLAFISAKTNNQIGKKGPNVYLPEFIDNFGKDKIINELSKQCIPNDPSLWEVDAYEDFLVKRRELIVERLNRFLGHEGNEA